MSPLTKKKKKAPAPATKELSPTAILQRMEKEEGRFVVRTPEEFEILLSIEGNARQRVTMVKIERWPDNNSLRTKNSKKAFLFFPTIKSRKPVNNSPPPRPSKPTRGQLQELSQFPNLTGLDLSHQKEHFVASLVETPRLLPQRLTHLDLSYNRLFATEHNRTAGACSLSAEGVLPSTLISLKMKNTRIESAGARALLKSGALARLTSLSSLDLSNNGIGKRVDGGIASSLVPGVFPEGLKHLNLEDNYLGDEAVAALSRPDVLPVGLTRLNLKHCNITSEGVESLSNAQLPNLTDFTLARNDIGSDGAAYLSASTFTRSLSRLDIGGCGIGWVGAGHLIDNCESFVNLKILILRSNKMGESAVVILEERFHKQLDTLNVNNNDFNYHHRHGLTNEYWTKEDYRQKDLYEEEARAREEAFRRLYF